MSDVASPKNFNRKWLWGGIIFVVIVGIGIGVYFYMKNKKKPSPQPVPPPKDNQIQVSINLTGNRENISTSPVTEYISVIQEEVMPDFVEKTLSGYLPTNQFITISWNTVTLDGNPITVSQGSINDSRTVSQFYNGIIPNTASLVADITYTCDENAMNKIDATCNRCNGEQAMCTLKGPICVPNMMCPEGDILKKCCVNSKDGPVPTCIVGSPVKCSGCANSKDCGDPGCTGIGPLCTSDGWQCVPGMKCPTGTSLEKCCSDSTLFPTCSDSLPLGQRNVICSKCKNSYTGKACGPDCKLSGLICDDSTDTMLCQVGAGTCPSPSILSALNCCTDPNKPFAVCTSKGITCTACEGLPQTGNCSPSCLGHGWKCTNQGWECLPGVECPTADELKELGCCSSYPGTNSVCVTDPNKNVCVQCRCASGLSACASIAQNCPVNGASPGNKCCPAGTVCKNNTCVPICGKDSSGNPVACGENQECVVLSGLSTAEQDAVEKQGANINFGIAYLCQDVNNGCNLGNELASPSAIDNYYPCWPFPQNSDNAGLGYCSYKNNVSDLRACMTKTKVADCTRENACQWLDVLTYTAENGEAGINRINSDMVETTNNSHGYYCAGNSSTPFQRLVGFSTNKCSWQDCYSRLSQPGISDVYFDEKTGNCMALQECQVEQNSGSVKNQIIDGSGKLVNNPNVNTSVSSNSIFSNSCSGASCPISDQSSYVCDSKGGLFSPTWSCVTKGAPIGGEGQVCTLITDGTGRYLPPNSNCLAQCVGQRDRFHATDYVNYIAAGTPYSRLISDNGRYQLIIDVNLYIWDNVKNTYGEGMINFNAESMHGWVFKIDPLFSIMISNAVLREIVYDVQISCSSAGGGTGDMGFYVVMQDDGNCVAYCAGAPKWNLKDGVL